MTCVYPEKAESFQILFLFQKQLLMLCQYTQSKFQVKVQFPRAKQQLQLAEDRKKQVGRAAKVMFKEHKEMVLLRSPIITRWSSMIEPTKKNKLQIIIYKL